MKQAFSILLALALVSPAWSAVAYVQSNSCNSDTAAVACATDSSVTAGNLLVAGCIISNFSDSISIASTPSETWTAVGPSIGNDNDTGPRRTAMWYANAVTGGATTVTCTATGGASTYAQVMVHEYSGQHATDPFNVGSSSAPIIQITNPIGKAITTSQTDEMIVTMALAMGGSVTAQSGTLRESFVFNEYMASQDTVAATAGSYNPSFTQGNAAWWVVWHAAFKEASAEPPPSPCGEVRFQ